ncbi:MAG: CoA-transferase subunit beta [Dehalococcoidia bacterium]
MGLRFSLDELMVIEASRQIEDENIVLVGTGLPMVASLLAQKSHAPKMCYVVETGNIAPEVIPTPTSVCDPRVMYKAIKHGSLLESLGGILQRGLTDIAFLGGAQIDEYANVNSTAIGDYNNPKVRLPGSGGANDLASHAKKILIITRHEKRRFPKNCDYITSPGYINGPEGRKDAGIVVKYPDIVVITNLCVMEIDKKSGKLVITKLMPNISIDDVMINTEFKPLIKSSVNVLDPTKKEIDTLRKEVDPYGVYLKDT